jgi:4-cresol dehydrogenase (hydroxylating)
MDGLAMARQIYDRHEFDMFVELIIESPRSIIMLLGVFYERNDAADSARATAWYKETRQSFMQKGYPPYRTTTMSMPGSSDPNPVSRDFLAAVKRAVDPQNLIAPGRYGMPERDGKDL